MRIGSADIVFLIIMAFFVIKVTITGFIDEFFSKAAVIVGGLVAFLFYKLLTPVITELLGEKSLSAIISFLILFLSVYLVIKLVQVFLGSLFSSESLKNLDRSLGFFLGLVEGLIVIGVILMLINIQTFVSFDKILSESIFAKILSPFILDITKQL
ncbi:CvpA family protein [Treponema putidum]|uniref:CvpA family protein n=1 Tax=Treponema putidum TaxID=221027 RepID=A0AAE9MU09_9SPIR|nr:CvpA family protein [Treponema putidum]AIN94265.1 colicin V production CvpA [Treponema putidum]TWI79743.1 membrane protein required for colicin V production [Treponema putidum]UTY28220.1 CvpA family protein [Treponema putidum]UTY30718.1 CvpA family protein [Treponema putidum]UTY33133.1 CvpA family protein [Treponema putidum]